jgi:hypothetical protein
MQHHRRLQSIVEIGKVKEIKQNRCIGDNRQTFEIKD